MVLLHNHVQSILELCYVCVNSTVKRDAAVVFEIRAAFGRAE
jgi:hypothetical protein